MYVNYKHAKHDICINKCSDFAVASVADFQQFRAPANSPSAGGFVEYCYWSQKSWDLHMFVK